MARSNYIYMVINPENKGVEAVIEAFTVKYEMDAFCKTIDMSGLKKYRFKDMRINPRNDLPKEIS